MKQLRSVMEQDPDPHVVIPAAEAVALADSDSDPRPVRVLADLAREDHPFSVRLEALNALTALEPGRVRPHRDTVAAAAAETDEYLRGAGRYLLFRVDGTYTPDSRVFWMEGM